MCYDIESFLSFKINFMENVRNRLILYALGFSGKNLNQNDIITSKIKILIFKYYYGSYQQP